MFYREYLYGRGLESGDLCTVEVVVRNDSSSLNSVAGRYLTVYFHIQQSDPISPSAPPSFVAPPWRTYGTNTHWQSATSLK
jgi:hypothetical protein